MAARRIVRAGFIYRAQVAQLDDISFRLFASMVIDDADDYGRLLADSERLAGALFWGCRKTRDEIEASLARLEVTGLIQRYFVGRHYAQIVAWEDLTSIERPRKSKHPGIEEDNTVSKLHTEMLEAFRETWAKKYGRPYVPTPADRSQLGRLLVSLKGEPDIGLVLPAVFRAYVGDSSDPLFKRVCHPLALFCTSGGFNRYRSRPGGGNGSSGSTRNVVTAPANWPKAGTIGRHS